jgi:hypothetical protein
MGAGSSEYGFTRVTIGKTSEEQLIDDQDPPGLNLRIRVAEKVCDPRQHSRVGHHPQ